MDESLKITIATISGFVIAFFAEPVKIYFQRRDRREGIRKALYQELYFNYESLRRFVDGRGETITRDEFHRFVFNLKWLSHTEAYQHYMTHDIDLFYQLKESMVINWLYGQLISLIETARARFDAKDDPNITLNIVKNYLQAYKENAGNGKFDRRFLVKCIGIEKLKLVLEKDFIEPEQKSN